MISAEPYLKDPLSAYTWTVPAFYVVTVVSVLWAGFVKNHRMLESRISARLASLAQQHGSQASISHDVKGGNAMLKILVPIDGARNSHFAVPHVIREFMKNRALEIHLLNIQPPFSWHIARFTSKQSRDGFHREQAEKALQPVRRALDSAGVPYTLHAEVGGDKAKLITEAARRLQCDHIVMSTARKNSLTRMLEDSTTNKVLELTSVPVELIAGDAVSRLERYGIPAGIGATLGLIFLVAAD
jgi:nucleotide-binding universal stress UspA family protein